MSVQGILPVLHHVNKLCARANNHFRIISGGLCSIGRTLAHGERTLFSERLNASVLIIGNGPSLNELDLLSLCNSVDVVACVNSFPIEHESFFQIKPDFLALLHSWSIDFRTKG